MSTLLASRVVTAALWETPFSILNRTRTHPHTRRGRMRACTHTHTHTHTYTLSLTPQQALWPGDCVFYEVLPQGRDHWRVHVFR